MKYLSNGIIDEIEFIREQFNHKIKDNNFWWIIGVLFSVIILLLTYKFWGKPQPLENLISIGSGLISIALAIVAIGFSVSESIKSNNKENKANFILDKIKDNVGEMQLLVKKIDISTTYTKTQVSDIKNEFKNYYNGDINKQEKNHNDNKSKKSDTSSTTSEKKGESSNNEKRITIKRGGMYWAEIENAGKVSKCPVIVISIDISNRYSSMVNVILVSTEFAKKNLPTHILFKLEDKQITALADKIITLEKSRLIECMATLDSDVMNKINQALIIQIGIL